MDAEKIRENRRKAKIVIKELRDHQQEVEEQKEEAEDCRSDVLTGHFLKAEENLTKSQTADQALLDAQIFTRLGVYAKVQAGKLQTGLQSCDVKSFTDNLILLMRKEDDRDDEADLGLSMNFIELGNSVRHCWKTVPGIDFMYGNAPQSDALPTGERAKAKRIKKGTIAVKPAEVMSHEVEQTETDRQVAEMRKELAFRKRCNYWVFVIDPNSFTRSIENVFHSSFLIKDMMAQLDLKVDPPVIRYTDPKQLEEEERDREGDNSMMHSQVILGFDKNVWLEMISKHNIRKCILPSKSRTDVRTDSQLQQLRAFEANGERNTASF